MGDEPDPLRALRQMIGTKRTLLVLDNFEQLTAAAERLVELLEAAPQLSLLVTSRVPLGLKAESRYSLDGLPLPATTAEALAEGASASGLTLYCQAARRYDPGFELNEVNLPAVLSICQRVAGSPLGIELAGALSHVVEPSELASELTANLDFLVSTHPDLPERHASLRSLFERSWSLLDVTEQAVLAGSTIFCGGFTRASAAGVLDMGVALLGSLLDRSLIRRRGSRYELHPLVQQYASEKLAQYPQAERWRARHAEYFCNFFHSKKPYGRHSGELQAFEELARDYPNLQTAWHWAAASARQDLLELSIQTVTRFLLVRGRFIELTQLLDAAEATAGPDSYLLARIMLVRAQVKMYSDPAAAQETFERVSILAREHQWEGAVAFALLGLGVARASLGDLPAAREYWLQALPLLERHDDELLLGACYSNLALTVADCGEYESWAERAEGVCRDRGLTNDLVKVLANQATHAAMSYGDYPAALGLLNEAIRLEYNEIGRPHFLARLHCHAGYYAVNTGDHPSAEQHLREASRLLAEGQATEEHAFRDGLAVNWATAHLHYARRELEEARDLAQEMLEEGNSRELICWIGLETGKLEAVEEQLSEPNKLLVGSPVPRNKLHAATVHQLLSAELTRAKHLAGVAKGDPTPDDTAVSDVISALKNAGEFNFVPLVLEAFVTAYALEPGLTGDELLFQAATHPAGRYHTRKRALRILSGAPTRDYGSAANRAYAAVRELGGQLSTAALLDQARDLGERLRAGPTTLTLA